MEFNLKKTLKALLFSTSEPLSIRDIQAVVTRFHQHAERRVQEQDESSDNGEQADAASPTVIDEDGQELMNHLIAQVPSLLTAAQIRDAMDAVNEDLAEREAVFRIVEGPQGYRMVLRPEYADWVRLLRDEPRPRKLSPAAMETLAIVSYRQPVTRAELEAIRGVSADSALNRLQENELICITGRADLPGRPLQYGTTDEFLELCGLKSIDQLPASDVLSPNQISAWVRQASIIEDELGDADVGLPEEAVAEAPE